MKKGFTLIELLAVIVILAIIALIATPIVLNIINDTRENAKIRSAELYLDALEQAIVREKMNNIGFNPSYCTIKKSVVTCEGMSEPLKVDVDGELPTSGTITLSNGKVVSHTLVLDGTTIVNGVIQDTQVPEEPEEEIVLSPGDTYTLKNGDKMLIVDDYDSTSPVIGNIVVLNDESEWIYEKTEGDLVTLSSRYNYFVTGENIGEMDTSGGDNAISLSSLEELNQKIEELGVKEKLAKSLVINESDINIGTAEFMPTDLDLAYWGAVIHGDGFEEFMSFPDAGYYERAGIRVSVTLNKSNIKMILLKINIKDYECDTNTGLCYSSDEIYKVKETEDQIYFISPFSIDSSSTIVDLTTGNYASSIFGGLSGCYDALRTLGYTEKEEGYEIIEMYIDPTESVEGVDGNAVQSVCGSNPIYSWDSSEISLLELSKN